MRKFKEPTFRNLLRPSLIWGLKPSAFTVLLPTALAAQALAGNSKAGSLASLGVTAGVYLGLRLVSRYGKNGWDESMLFFLEKLLSKSLNKTNVSELSLIPRVLKHPDAMSETELCLEKATLKRELINLKPDQSLCIGAVFDQKGDHCFEIKSSPDIQPKSCEVLSPFLENYSNHFVYQLHVPPVSTDPLWIFDLVAKLRHKTAIFCRIRGINPSVARKKVEYSRKSAAFSGLGTIDVDSDVTFNEATAVAEQMSKGEEKLVEFSLVIVSESKVDLDEELFTEEKSICAKELAIKSIVGMRVRMHRSSWLRADTATDLIPSFGDESNSENVALFESRRGKPLAIDLQDKAFPALHINVSGTTGAGKSVVTVALLNRMREQGVPMSVLFIDQLRSYRRPVLASGGLYFEPTSKHSLRMHLFDVFESLEVPGNFTGIELSELPVDQSGASIQYLLFETLEFLKSRSSSHPIYIVLDECWRLLGSEPMLVQSLFRECRKLDGAAVAVTQSLSDLLKDTNGQAVFQNTPIQMILRQKEDPARISSDLNLNDKEEQLIRSLEINKGEFTESLIKTPSGSYLARIRLSEAEHALFRTDTIRSEVVALRRREKEVPVEAI